MIRRLVVTFALLGLLLPFSLSHGADKKKKDKPAKPATEKPTPKPPAPPPPPSPWGDFVEKDFPFFSSVLDARDVGEGFPKENLTPRGIILNLGHNLWACFDTDLLRIACIWEGEEGKPPVTPDALAPGSYHVAGQKTKDGQDFLPKPIGKVWLANGIYPGWQVGDKPSFTDPREPGPSKEEVGKGPIGSFKSVRATNEGVLLEYSIGNLRIEDALSSEASWLDDKGTQKCFTVRRFVRVLGVTDQEVQLVLSQEPSDSDTQTRSQILFLDKSDPGQTLGRTNLPRGELQSIRYKADGPDMNRTSGFILRAQPSALYLYL